MQTSNFMKIKAIIAAGLTPIAISRGVPSWYKGRRELRLAPTRAMLKMSAEDYNAQFFARLAKLDPRELFAKLGDDAVLLCWEKPGDRCHRRAVAEWFEQALGITVKEFGIPRRKTPAFS